MKATRAIFSAVTLAATIVGCDGGYYDADTGRLVGASEEAFAVQSDGEYVDEGSGEFLDSSEEAFAARGGVEANEDSPIQFEEVTLSPTLAFDYSNCGGSPICQPDIRGAFCKQEVTSQTDLSQDLRAAHRTRAVNGAGQKVKTFDSGFLFTDNDGIQTRITRSRLKMTDFDPVEQKPVDQHCGATHLEFMNKKDGDDHNSQRTHKHLFLNMNANQVVQEWPNADAIDFDRLSTDGTPAMVSVKSYKRRVSPVDSVCAYEIVYQNAPQKGPMNKANIKTTHLQRTGAAFNPSGLRTSPRQARRDMSTASNEREMIYLSTEAFPTVDDSISCESVEVSLHVDNKVVETHKIKTLNTIQ